MWPNFSMDLDRAEKSQVSFFYRATRKKKKIYSGFREWCDQTVHYTSFKLLHLRVFLRNEREKKKKGKSIWYPSEFAAFYIYMSSWPLMIITARCLLIASSKSSRRWDVVTHDEWTKLGRRESRKFIREKKTAGELCWASCDTDRRTWRRIG